jgi:hypothetical protein
MRTLSVPIGVKVRAHVNVYVQGNVNVGLYISDPDANDELPVVGATAPLSDTYANSTKSEFYRLMEWTNASAQVRSRLSAADASIALAMATLGWVDTRGRND